LWQAGRGILHGEPGFGSVVSGKDFRQTVAEEDRSFKNAGNDLRRFFAEPVACESGGYEAAVVGPDRSVVVLDGIVSALTLGHGSYAPSGEHFGAHQVVANIGGLIVIHDAAPQQLADVGAQAVHLAFGTVEGNGEELSVRNPVVLVEAAFELCCFLLQLYGQRLVFPDLARQTSTAHFSIVGVALDFTSGARRGCQGAIVEENGVPGVFPALVVQAQRGFAFIFDITVAIAVAVVVDPV